ncbi:MAG TPA: A/G-specific adenine glycosylase [Chitinophagaceae bacterium]|nr:A/G-specific adenine glycosylase [Chitinophagaceae bacterium]
MQKMLKKAPARTLQNGFSRQLLAWNARQNKRQMPWKGEKDPYKIWLSEIILQQTRVEQGLEYYNRFIAHYPTIVQLANAPDTQVFKLWEGLGYYSRCRNLLATARYIATAKKGIFPDTCESIQSLKGIGPYTAAAIASFAYNLPHAVVDGNVYRVLARVFGIHTPIDSTAGKKQFTALAEALLDKKQPGLYNQAIMDFGATVCKPLAPLCGTCIFQKECYAYQQNEISLLPVKEKKNKIRKRWFYYLVIEWRGKTAVRQRTAKDIWQGLYEFPLTESPAAQTPETIIREALQKKWWEKNEYVITSVSPLLKQQLSHQLIQAQFIRIKLSSKPVLPEGYEWVNAAELRAYAFPRIINVFLEG